MVLSFNKVSEGLFLFSTYFKFLLNKFSTGEFDFLSIGEDFNFSTGDRDSSILIKFTLIIFCCS
jgi:hypothetical protein